MTLVCFHNKYQFKHTRAIIVDTALIFGYYYKAILFTTWLPRQTDLDDSTSEYKKDTTFQL